MHLFCILDKWKRSPNNGKFCCLFVGLPAIKPYNRHFSCRVAQIRRKILELLITKLLKARLRCTNFWVILRGLPSNWCGSPQREPPPNGHLKGLLGDLTAPLLHARCLARSPKIPAYGSRFDRFCWICPNSAAAWWRAARTTAAVTSRPDVDSRRTEPAERNS